MDIQLSSWLERTFEEQLLLGNSWLQEKNKTKESRVKSKFDRNWEGLYHDNGSCLEIINWIHPERNSSLQVNNPLTLTDGQSQVVSHLTSDCVRDLSRPLLLHSVIAVRKYTIRYTPYGPPRAKLRFILNKIDWLGAKTESAPQPNTLKPLDSCQEIGAVLKQLHETRAREDLRCLRSATHSELDEAAMADDMDLDGGAPVSESAPHTQLPQTQLYGTQLARPTRSKAGEDAPQFMGLKRLEPVLAGNTKREELHPNYAANSDYETRMTLLSLLEKTAPKAPKQSPSKPSPASAKGLIRSAFDNKQSPAKPSTTHASPKPTVSVDRLSTRAGAQEQDAPITPLRPTPNRKRANRSDPNSPAAVSVERLSDLGHGTREDSPDNNVTAESECSWMKGLVFNREALRVPYNQQLVLQKPTSWDKTLPGEMDLPTGNIPVTILRVLDGIADEKAALEGAQDTDSEADFDPSPDSIVDNINPSPEDMPNFTQNTGPATSQVSWSASSSPEPPQKTTGAHQDLPPDSSFETERPNTNISANWQYPASRPSPQPSTTVGSSNEKEPSPPSSSPPAPATQHKPGFSFSSKTKNPVEVPAPELPPDSDEEMEMETQVPIGLGEDAQPTSHPQRSSKNLLGTKPPRVESVLQVKETPYAKGSGDAPTFAASAPQSKQDSSGNTKNTSSTSIVYGTYNEPKSSTSSDGGDGHGTMSNKANNRLSDDVPMHSLPLDLETPMEQANDGDQARATPLKTVVTPARTPASAQVPANSQSPLTNQLPSAEVTSPQQHELSSGLNKRKMDESPSNKSKRPNKRREIKIMGFGDATPSTIDPLTVRRQEREESLRRFREERNSSRSFESRPRSDHVQQDLDAMEVDSPGKHASNASLHSMSPRHRSLYEDMDVKPQSKATSVLQLPLPTFRSEILTTAGQRPVAGNEEESLTLFQTFKAAYPEYTGGVKHFQGLCLQMYKLDLEDKMVPKWQWDDFIIRNRTDYKDYAAACADEGEDPEPYYRFYKDSIRDTLFKTGIIESRGTLLSALAELGVDLPEATEPSREPTRPNKLSRASLPGVFNSSHKQPAHDRLNGNRPRHSLPTMPRMAALDSPTPQPHP
ncbi:hypothetical protein N0V83_002701 [Neocucurbitaria cava]|uniref:Telomere replication protein EST3 n=1 Tax=Neocucurbitaria cava TaxID=798079 RepID=A0A9W8YFF7_9PLEO|nr:hypothetical protein N0V83_002701 [Neocucurbitaria cava]